MEKPAESDISSDPAADIVKRPGKSNAWKPSKIDVVLIITLKQSTEADQLTFTPQTKPGQKPPSDLDKFRFTVDYKEKGATDFKSYSPDGTKNSKVSSHSPRNSFDQTQTISNYILYITI